MYRSRRGVYRRTWYPAPPRRFYQSLATGGNITISAPVATATATALTPTIQATVLPATATATAQAPTPVVTATILPPAATATATALTPTPIVKILPAAAAATAQALVPVIAIAVTPPAAAATAQALTPTLQATIIAPVAVATAQALTPTVTATILPPAAGATATALTPVVRVTILPPAAAATAMALVPVILGPASVGTVVFVSPVSRPMRATGLLPEAHGQYQDVLSVSTVRGTYTFSASYTTGGETVTIPIQRTIVQLLPAKRAGGKAIIWTGAKLQAWNVDGSDNPTTEVTAGTDLSAVVVPLIAYVIAH